MCKIGLRTLYIEPGNWNVYMNTHKNCGFMLWKIVGGHRKSWRHQRSAPKRHHQADDETVHGKQHGTLFSGKEAEKSV